MHVAVCQLTTSPALSSNQATSTFWQISLGNPQKKLMHPKSCVWEAISCTNMPNITQHSFHDGRVWAQNGTLVASTHGPMQWDCQNGLRWHQDLCPKLTTPALEPTRRSRPVGASPKNIDSNKNLAINPKTPLHSEPQNGAFPQALLNDQHVQHLLRRSRWWKVRGLLRGPHSVCWDKVEFTRNPKKRVNFKTSWNSLKTFLSSCRVIPRPSLNVTASSLKRFGTSFSWIAEWLPRSDKQEG